LWMSLLPCPLRKKYFTIARCSIRSIQIFIAYRTISIKCRSGKSLSAIPYREIFSRKTYDWFRNWFGFEDFIRLSTIFSAEKSRQDVRYFFATLYSYIPSSLTARWSAWEGQYTRLYEMNCFSPR
jgi:hypothetical protein